MPRMRRSIRVLVPLAALVTLTVHARGPTFEDRVQAQMALERVYYAHTIGASKPFEEAVPRAVLEAKVERYLKQSAALETYWHTPVTAEMLQAEMQRQARETRMPERLRELYAALGNDPVLIQECLARATLVDRLTRNFYAFDAHLHAAARQEADTIRAALAGGTLDPWQAHPLRTEVELVRGEDEGGGEPRPGENHAPKGPQRLALSPAQFDEWKRRVPDAPGKIYPVDEDREAFEVRGLLDGDDAHLRVVAYRIEKTNWDTWWSTVTPRLDADEVSTVASPDAAVPSTFGRHDRPSSPFDWELGGERTTGASGISPCVVHDVWDEGSSPVVPVPRTGHTAVWTGSVMVVWGGSDSDTSLSTGGRYDPTTDNWTPTSTVGAPQGRVDHTAVWTGSTMVVWGGHESEGTPEYLDSGGRYDPVTDTWAPTSTAGAPQGRVDHTAVWTGSLMVVWGGYDGSSYLDTGGRYSPATDTWAPTSTAGIPAGRTGHTAVWTGSHMMVWGGTVIGNASVNTGGSYDPLTDTWTSTSTAGAPQGRVDHTAIWTGQQMMVWGGVSYNPSFTYLNDGGGYDPASNTWTPISTIDAPQGRRYHTAVWTGGLMVVWGGHGGAPLNTGGRYDPASDTWTPTSIAGPSARSRHTAVWTGSQMVVWGGTLVGPYLLNTGARYDPANDSWTPTFTAATPEGRRYHAAVWTGNLMVVWGGQGQHYTTLMDLDSGGRYDPATDLWTPTSTVNAPQGRSSHTAVWTGERMVVWGGWSPNGAEESGGRYDPITDTWTPTSMLDAPSARGGHTSVWTGSRMVVWGGASNIISFVNTGGRYDPLTDTWTPTSTIDAPSARGDHTAVWTGSRMVVWGGGLGQPNSSTKTGGRYDPDTDSWTPTSLDGAPAARSWHSAVWTGNGMVVWGGDGPHPGALDTGGRYDPSSDTWTPTSTTNVPSPRLQHSAVWTGSLVVIWGGTDVSGNELYTGGRYDPLDDTWTATSLSDVPEERVGHTAVWTGSTMVVWGGHNVGMLDTGGRYDPFKPVDTDGDGAGCLVDCNDADAGVYAAPTEVTGLRFAADGVTCEWDSAVPGAGSATVHDVLTGVVAELPVGSGASETCLETSPASSIVVSDVPASGSGFWYLVRGRNLCGAGTYGSASDGTPRESAACP